MLCQQCQKERPIKQFRPGHKKCRSCENELRQAWRVSNRTQDNLIAATFRNRNREALKLAQRDYRASFPERVAASKAKYHRNNRERWAFYKANRKAQTNCTHVGSRFTLQEWKSIQHEQGYRCVWCLELKPLTIDHLVPLSRGGHHTASNIVGACKSCNSSKKDKMPEAFANQLGIL